MKPTDLEAPDITYIGEISGCKLYIQAPLQIAQQVALALAFMGAVAEIVSTAEKPEAAWAGQGFDPPRLHQQKKSRTTRRKPA